MSGIPCQTTGYDRDNLKCMPDNPNVTSIGVWKRFFDFAAEDQVQNCLHDKINSPL
jgi:hypothetical protein